MQKKYYHDTYFQKIVKLAEEYRLEEALHEFQKYLTIYPNDVDSYVHYAITLIKSNLLEDAEYILKKAEGLINDKTSRQTCEDFIMAKVNLFSCQKRYQECYNLLLKNIQIYYRRKWIFKEVLCFLKRELNILTPEDYKKGKFSYLQSQILFYSEEEAIKHIQKHKNEQEKNSIQFVNEFPLIDMYYKCRNLLPSENKVYPNSLKNSYVFGYRANGHTERGLVDYFEVITLQDSNDIITMYPYENREKRKYIDLNPDLENEQLKRKRVSQIDKFNKKYGNMNK